mmetsp:Transcript_393/g.905  ORF Transcript_393/g.905 Transcript_393/m.905 type:complete len:139 (+) Transcript_393:2755-3171(+)
MARTAASSAFQLDSRKSAGREGFALRRVIFRRLAGPPGPPRAPPAPLRCPIIMPESIEYNTKILSSDVKYQSVKMYEYEEDQNNDHEKQYNECERLIKRHDMTQKISKTNTAVHEKRSTKLGETPAKTIQRPSETRRK